MSRASRILPGLDEVLAAGEVHCWYRDHDGSPHVAAVRLVEARPCLMAQSTNGMEFNALNPAVTWIEPVQPPWSGPSES